MRYFLFFICIFAAAACSGENAGGKADNKIPDKAGKITVVDGSDSAGNEKVSRFIGYNMIGEYRVNYAPDGKETPLTKEIGAHVVIRNAPYGSIHKSLLMKRLSKNFIVKCSACHDDYGNGVIGPSLLTKSGDEIYAMIMKYKTDKEKNELMRRLVKKMDDEEIRFIADDIAKFNKEIREGAAHEK